MAASQLSKFLVCGLALLFGGCEAAGTEETSKRKIIIILGPPCAGCGTQSPDIVKTWGIPHLDTGNMLRQAGESGTPAGLEAAKMMKEGVLVTDDIVNRVVADRIHSPDCAKGFLLDGYPRNVAQSAILDKILAATGEAVTDVLSLEVPMKGLEQCVMHRWTSDSGDEFTSDYFPFQLPKSLPAGAKPQCDPHKLEQCNMWDDETGEPLFRRADDNLKTLHQRVKTYNELTAPVLAHYKSQNVLEEVDGYQPKAKVRADIENFLGNHFSTGLVAEAIRSTDVLMPVAAVALVAAAGAAIAVALAVLSRPRNGDKSEPLLMA